MAEQIFTKFGLMVLEIYHEITCDILWHNMQRQTFNGAFKIGFVSIGYRAAVMLFSLPTLSATYASAIITFLFFGIITWNGYILKTVP